MTNDIGNAIREARVRAGLSQVALAAAAGGRNVTQINAYERGRSRPSPRVLDEIAQALGLSSDTLLGVVATATGQLDVNEMLEKFRRRIADATNVPITRVRVLVEFG